jgi:hypothetical protein
MSPLDTVRLVCEHRNVPAKGTIPTLSGHVVAGLVDAEAHFAIEEHNGGGSVSCKMVLAMRDDDVDLLHQVVRTTRLGIVRPKDQRGAPQAAWQVYRKDEVAALVDYLACYPLRSRKQLDFEVWRAAVREWHSAASDRVRACRSFAARFWQRAPIDAVATPWTRAGSVASASTSGCLASSRAMVALEFPAGLRGSR